MSTHKTSPSGCEFGKKLTKKEKIRSLDRIDSATTKILNHTSLNPDNIKEHLISLKPSALTPSSDFKWEYMLSEVLSKLNRDGSDPQVTYDAAIKKLYESEARCKRINDEGLNGLGIVPHTYFERVMFSAQKIVSDILGPISYEMFKDCKFSNGASTHRKKVTSTPFHKYNTRKPVGVTRGASKYARALITLTPLWDVYGGNHNLQHTVGNQVFTVPKNSETDRAACKEPCVNMALQLGVGQHIRQRLRRYGVNLNKQCVNQKLALYGSQTGRLATIDLKAASDSISQRFVFELVPLEWYELLNSLRSPYGLVNSYDNNEQSIVKWEKHSTMGNGYTFELESLLFFAISRAVVDLDPRHCGRGLDHSVSVYGDDIIVPTYASSNVISTLRACGFETNLDKTFTEGPFRESCGKHYFEGIDVSPFYIRKAIDSVNRVVWLLNTLRKWSDDGLGHCDSAVYPYWLKLRRSFVPSFLLGGNQVESISSVASPDKPRQSLVEKRKLKRVNGVPGVLQALQLMGHKSSECTNPSRMTPFLFNNREAHTNWVKWYDQVEYDCDSPNHEFITVPTETPSLTVIVNEAIEIPFGLWLDEYFETVEG